jgi:hypothetical protein
MPVIPNLEGLLPAPLLPSEELDKERHGDEEKKRWLDQELCQSVSILKGSRRMSVWIAQEVHPEPA